MNSFDLPRTYSYASTCPKCSQVTGPFGDISGAYFETGSVKCASCGTDFDLWDAMLDRLVRLSGFTTSLSALGPRVTHLRIRVPANQSVEMDLTKFGISDGATILFVLYSPNDNSLPLEWWGNTPPRRFRGTRAYLYGVQCKTSDGVPIEEQLSGENVGVTVLWAPMEDSVPWLYLVDAIEAVSVKRYSQAIVPAHAAAEISITPIVYSILAKYSAKSDVERLMRQELSFASVLNVVIPLVCPLVGAKALNTEIRQNLNALRRIRNEFVHRGILPNAINERDVLRFLCAAAFGHEYGKYLKGFLG